MSSNQNKYKIHPDFAKISRNIPFDKKIITMAHGVQTLMYQASRIPAGIRDRKFTVPGFQGLEVPVELFEPEGMTGNTACLLFIHGGGFGYKAAVYHKQLACIYAKQINCKVVLPDYHLLPDYPFPAAYEDVRSVYEWICGHAEELSVDKTRIAVAGDSAGGALAANLCNTVSEHQLIPPCFQMLVYPVTDVLMQSDSMKRYPDTPLWNAVNNRKMWSMYLAEASAAEKKLASPMQNKLPEQIPETYIETAEFDCLYDDGIAYAAKLKAAGAKVEVYETAGTIHGYDSQMKSAITKESIKRRVERFRRAFS